MSDPEKCPGCGGGLGTTDNCRVCAYYAVLDERPNPDALLAERRDMDQMGRDLEACRVSLDAGTTRHWFHALAVREDIVARVLSQAWVDLDIDRNAPDFLELLDQCAVAEYDVTIAQRRRDEFWGRLKNRSPSIGDETSVDGDSGAVAHGRSRRALRGSG